MNLPPELLDQILLDADYETVIVLLVNKLITLDEHFWARKARYDFGVTRSRFYHPNNYDVQLVPRDDQAFNQLRYVQIASRFSVVYGSEAFISLQECLIRAVKIKDKSLIDYFIARCRELGYDGVEYGQRSLLKGALLNADLELYQRLVTYDLLSNLYGYHYIQNCLFNACQGGDIDIIMDVYRRICSTIITRDRSNFNLPYDLRSSLAQHHQYHLFSDPRIMRLGTDSGGDNDEEWLGIDRYDQIKDITIHYGTKYFEAGVEEMPISIVKDAVKAKSSGSWDPFIRRALEDGDRELCDLILERIPRENKVIGLSLCTIVDTDLVDDFETQVPGYHFFTDQPDRQALLLDRIKRGSIGKEIVHHLIDYKYTDLILMLDQHLERDHYQRDLIRRYLK